MMEMLVVGFLVGLFGYIALAITGEMADSTPHSPVIFRVMYQ